MRQIYTSPRLENVDRVVALLQEHGIATSVTDRKPYGGGQWKRFSYRDSGSSEPWPKVWVVDPNDQVKAREVMRAAGLDPGSRRADDYAAAVAPGATTPAPGWSVANRVRLAALGLVGLGAVLLALRGCGKI